MNKLTKLVVLCVLFSALFWGVDRFVFPWLHKINYVYRKSSPSFQQAELGLASERDLKLARDHLQRAISELENPREPKQVAAAVNAYLYQLLLLQNNAKGPIEILKDEYAICGGHARAMCALLELAGIQSELAFMIDVPGQGGHSMVQVTFSEAEKGLYDPTFGVYWKGEQGPLSIAQLKQQPEWAVSHGYQALSQKRHSRSQQVVPIQSEASGYQPYDATDPISYQSMFSAYSNAGVACAGQKVFKQVPIVPGQTLGSINRARIKQSYAELESEQDSQGKYLSWLNHLGRRAEGYRVSQIYNCTQLVPGVQYRLVLYYLRSVEANLSVAAVGGEFTQSRSQTQYYSLPDFGPHLLQMIPFDLPGKGRSVAIDFIADKPEVSVVVDTEGELLLHAIALEEAADGQQSE